MATTPSLTLYTAERCPYAARVRMTLAQKGLDYERVEIDLDDRPAFMFEKNPTGTVPVLEQADGFVLPESRAIMEYLEESFPEPALLPGQARERAQVRVALDRFERFSNAYYGWRYRNGPAEKLDEQLRVLDAALGDAPFLVGDRLTLADIAYAPWILRLEQRGVPVRGFGRLAAWLDELGKYASIVAEVATVAALPTSARDTGDLGFWRRAAAR